MRKKTSAPRECTAPNLMDFDWSSMLFFLSLSKPSHPTVRISKPKRHLLYVRYTSTMYSVLLRSGARHGETPRIGGNPKNQPISELDIFSKRQALSRAVVVNSNMSRGKYLAREGPGSRLHVQDGGGIPALSRILRHFVVRCDSHLFDLGTRGWEAHAFLCLEEGAKPHPGFSAFTSSQKRSKVLHNQHLT